MEDFSGDIPFDYARYGQFFVGFGLISILFLIAGLLFLHFALRYKIGRMKSFIARTVLETDTSFKRCGGCLAVVLTVVYYVFPISCVIIWGALAASELSPQSNGVCTVLIIVSLATFYFAVGRWHAEKWRMSKPVVAGLFLTFAMFVAFQFVVIFFERPYSYIGFSAVFLSLSGIPVILIIYNRTPETPITLEDILTKRIREQGDSDTAHNQAMRRQWGKKWDVLLYIASLGLLAIYASVTVALVATEPDRYIGWVTMALLVVTDFVIFVYDWAGFLNRPFYAASLVVLFRIFIIFWGAEFWFIGHCCVFSFMAIYLGVSVVDDVFPAPVLNSETAKNPARAVLAKLPRGRHLKTSIPAKSSHKEGGRTAEGRAKQSRRRREEEEQQESEDDTRSEDLPRIEGRRGNSNPSDFSDTRVDASDEERVKCCKPGACKHPLKNRFTMLALVSVIFAIETLVVGVVSNSSALTGPTQHRQWLWGWVALMGALSIPLWFLAMRLFARNGDRVSIGMIVAAALAEILFILIGIYFLYVAGTIIVLGYSFFVPLVALSFWAAWHAWGKNDYHFFNHKEGKCVRGCGARQVAMVVGSLLVVCCAVFLCVIISYGPTGQSWLGWTLGFALLMPILTILPLKRYFATLKAGAFVPLSIVAAAICLILYTVLMFVLYLKAEITPRSLALLFLIVLYPTMVLLLAGIWKWYDDDWKFDVRTPAGKFILASVIVSAAMMIAFCGTLIKFVDWRAGIAILIASFIFYYALALTLLWVHKGYFLPRGARILSIILLLLAIGFGIAVGVVSSHVGGFTVIWAAIWIFVLAHAFSEITDAARNGRFYSPTVFPVYKMHKANQVLVKANRGVVYIYVSLLVPMFWGVVMALTFNPAWAGLVAAALSTGLMAFLTVHLLSLPGANLALAFRYVERHALEQARLRARHAEMDGISAAVVGQPGGKKSGDKERKARGGVHMESSEMEQEEEIEELRSLKFVPIEEQQEEETSSSPGWNANAALAVQSDDSPVDVFRLGRLKAEERRRSRTAEAKRASAGSRKGSGERRPSRKRDSSDERRPSRKRHSSDEDSGDRRRRRRRRNVTKHRHASTTAELLIQLEDYKKNIGKDVTEQSEERRGTRKCGKCGKCAKPKCKKCAKPTCKRVKTCGGKCTAYKCKCKKPRSEDESSERRTSSRDSGRDRRDEGDRRNRREQKRERERDREQQRSLSLREQWIALFDFDDAVDRAFVGERAFMAHFQAIALQLAIGERTLAETVLSQLFRADDYYRNITPHVVANWKASDWDELDRRLEKFLRTQRRKGEKESRRQEEDEEANRRREKKLAERQEAAAEKQRRARIAKGEDEEDSPSEGHQGLGDPKHATVTGDDPEDIIGTVESGTWKDPTFRPSEDLLLAETANSVVGWAHAKDLRGRHRSKDDSKPVAVFVDGSDPGDIVQGGLGDCWFLSAIAVLATKPQLVKNLFITRKPNKQGVYCVKFWVGGQWVRVCVDDYFPVTKGNIPAYAHSQKVRELWVMLLEKAYAKLNGSYAALDGGLTHVAMVDMTGGCGEQLDFVDNSGQRSQDALTGKLWEKMLSDYKSGFLLGVGSNAGSDKNVSEANIVQGHAYSVLRVELVDGKRLIQLRNPWGASEWTGDWSDSSNLWTERMKGKLSYYPEDPRDDAANDDGIFWMEYSDLIAEFRCIFVCRIFPDHWATSALKSEWTHRNAGGCKNYASCIRNPQFSLEVTRPTECHIMLSRDLAARQVTHLAIHVFSPEKGSMRVNPQRAHRIADSGPYSPTRDVSLATHLDAGMYVVMVSTYEPNQKGRFVLAVHSDYDVELKILPDVDDNTRDLE